MKAKVKEGRRWYLKIIVQKHQSCGGRGSGGNWSERQPPLSGQALHKKAGFAIRDIARVIRSSYEQANSITTAGLYLNTGIE